MSDHPFYWLEPHIMHFEVNVIDCKKEGDIFEIVIDQDCIRSSGGGQAGDKGTLRSEKNQGSVIDTIMKDDNVILICDSAFEPGTSAKLEIDSEWRVSMMQHHTSEHLLASILSNAIPNLELGYIWIDGLHGTVEFTGSNVSLQFLFEVERKVQAIIFRDLPVETKFVSPEDLAPEVRAREGLAEKHDTIRTVVIEGIDASACSGIHVTRTSEIGFFKIINYKYSENKIRIEFLAGERASDFVYEIFNQALVRKYEYPFEMEQLGNVLEKGKAVITEKKEILLYLEELIISNCEFEEIRDIVFRYYHLPGVDTGFIKRIVKKLKSDSKEIVLLFIPGEKTNFTVWVNMIDEKPEEFVKEIMKELNGRGGGSKTVYTGGFVDIEFPQLIFERIIKEIKQKIKNIP